MIDKLSRLLSKPRLLNGDPDILAEEILRILEKYQMTPPAYPSEDGYGAIAAWEAE